MSNEREKRKLANMDTVSRSQQKIKHPSEVTDEEVEEFSAILRRMNTAANYFKRSGASQGRWREALEEQIMQQVKEKGGVKNLDLNLNESPQSG
ncbi:hypothetical protein RJT34_07246 [Clitoria ternatea]|uniref:Uncharacterized protein n=1 Tax=Clitoria ternatea TaxID=43366 RepID=A0AAN9K493_CLITE